MDKDENGHLVWIRLGEEFRAADAGDAAEQRYSGLLQDIAAYVAR